MRSGSPSCLVELTGSPDAAAEGLPAKEIAKWIEILKSEQ
jgi:hypothetical protein